jgi:hypothetical protein
MEQLEFKKITARPLPIKRGLPRESLFLRM